MSSLCRHDHRRCPELWTDPVGAVVVDEEEGEAWEGMRRRRRRSAPMRTARARSMRGTTVTAVDIMSATSTVSAILGAVMIQRNTGTSATAAVSTSRRVSAEVTMDKKAEPMVDQALRLMARGKLRAGKRRLDAAFSVDMSDEDAERLARKTMLCWTKWMVRMRRR